MTYFNGRNITFFFFLLFLKLVDRFLLNRSLGSNTLLTRANLDRERHSDGQADLFHSALAGAMPPGFSHTK